MSKERLKDAQQTPEEFIAEVLAINRRQRHLLKLIDNGERLVPGLHHPIDIFRHFSGYVAIEKILGQSYLKPKIFEVGFGEGYGTFYLANFAERVHAIDIDPNAVKYASIRYQKPNLTFTHQSIDEFLAQTSIKKFEAIVLCHTLEHLSDPWRNLAALSNILKPGGGLFVTTPNAPVEHHGFHLNEFTLSGLLNLREDLTSKGFYRSGRIYGLVPSNKVSKHFRELGTSTAESRFSVKRAVKQTLPQPSYEAVRYRLHVLQTTGVSLKDFPWQLVEASTSINEPKFRDYMVVLEK